MSPLERSPDIFARISRYPGQADAKIRMRAPGLKGSVSGIVRHAQNGQYMIELYGRGELFLKVYFTEKQTILWPAVGMPIFFSNDSIPTLKQSVHRLLPNWRLDDVLPIPLRITDEHAAIEWKSGKNGESAQRIDRPGFETIYKTYAKRNSDLAFPYRIVSIGNESGRSRLTWSIQPQTGAHISN